MKPEKTRRKRSSAFRDPLTKGGESDPYEELAPFGVAYDSSMADVHNGGMTAQRQRALTSSRREAWSVLRNPEKRLVMDFFYYQRDPSSFSSDNRLKERGPFPVCDLWPLLESCWSSPREPTPLPLPESFLEEES